MSFQSRFQSFPYKTTKANLFLRNLILRQNVSEIRSFTWQKSSEAKKKEEEDNLEVEDIWFIKKKERICTVRVMYSLLIRICFFLRLRLVGCIFKHKTLYYSDVLRKHWL